MTRRRRLATLLGFLLSAGAAFAVSVTITVPIEEGGTIPEYNVGATVSVAGNASPMGYSFVVNCYEEGESVVIDSFAVNLGQNESNFSGELDGPWSPDQVYDIKALSNGEITAPPEGRRGKFKTVDAGGGGGND